MRPIATDLGDGALALNEVFGTKSQVRLLRALATETDGYIASPEAAARLGMTPSGARKALRRLTKAGVVEKVGAGRTTRYVLKHGTDLADEIVRLFQLERQRIDPGWGRTRHQPPSVPQRGPNGNGTGAAQGDDSVAQKSQKKLDPESPQFNDALVSLLEQDLSLIKRAREKVLEKLEHRHPGNGHDDWEWRKILDTYPLPRLLNFLESDSPRAIRLRKSSPFPEVMSDRERERLGDLVERVN